MAKKKRKLSVEKEAILKEYRKERRKLQQRIRYYRDRGFLIPESVVPKIPKDVTCGSIRNIKRASEKLFDKAVYKVRDNIGYGGRIYKPGDVVYGKRGIKIYQKEERQYRKAARALERGEEHNSLTAEDQARLEGKVQDRLEGKAQYLLEGTAEAFDELIYNRVISMLMEYDITDNSGTAREMYELIIEEEDKVGRSEVARRFYEAGEETVERLQVYLYYKFRHQQLAESAKADFLAILYRHGE